MAQRPLALSLQVCEKVVVEAETRNLILVDNELVASRAIRVVRAG